MSESNLIPAKDFCLHHRIEISFIHSLREYGIIEVTESEEDYFLDAEQLNELEKLVRLHYDLHINLEGIDAIQHLLLRMEEMQKEVSELRNKLRLYEASPPPFSGGTF